MPKGFDFGAGRESSSSELSRRFLLAGLPPALAGGAGTLGLEGARLCLGGAGVSFFSSSELPKRFALFFVAPPDCAGTDGRLFVSVAALPPALGRLIKRGFFALFLSSSSSLSSYSPFFPLFEGGSTAGRVGRAGATFDFSSSSSSSDPPNLIFFLPAVDCVNAGGAFEALEAEEALLAGLPKILGRPGGPYGLA